MLKKNKISQITTDSQNITDSQMLHDDYSYAKKPLKSAEYALNFPPTLRKLVKNIKEDMRIKTLKEMSEMYAIPYASVIHAIGRARKKGFEFYDLLALLEREITKPRTMLVKSSVYEQSLAGSVPAARLFLEVEKQLENRHGGDRNQIQVNVFTAAAPMPLADESDVITIESEEVYFSAFSPFSPEMPDT